MDYKDLKIPNHVAIIVDGNGRWATSRGKSRSFGHDAGLENLKKLTKYAFLKGISYLSVFVFSTENFKRSKEEVAHLMKLFTDFFQYAKKEYKNNNIKVLFSGSKNNLNKVMLKNMEEITNLTKDCTGGTLNICLNYGGQTEIVDAVNKILLTNKKEITIDEFSKYLYQDLPPVDLMIRTSGEERISNFMLWQLAYAEMYFPPTLFPDFDEGQFDSAIVEYTKRDRRFGNIDYDKLK